VSLGEADREALEQAAMAAREEAYAPYSHYRVGAAVRTASGAIFTGANVENASYGLTICAERVAVAKAITAGERELTAVAVATDGDPPAAPCGMCRQTLVEFTADMDVYLVGRGGTRRQSTLAQLLPMAFRPDDLG
jgi:cytidine deaminase